MSRREEMALRKFSMKLVHTFAISAGILLGVSVFRITVPELRISSAPSRPGRAPASVDRAPDSYEQFEKIRGYLKKYYGIEPAEVRNTEAFLEAHASGKGATVPQWMEGGYFPILLGGLSHRESSWAKFIALIEPDLRAFVTEKKWEGDPLTHWADFCGTDPGSCANAQRSACESTRNDPGDTAAKKILDLLRLRKLSDAGIDLHRIPKCEPTSLWWMGKCHLTPLAMAWFREQPMPRIVDGISLGYAEFEVIALAPTELWQADLWRGKVGEHYVGDWVGGHNVNLMHPALDDVNPASLVYTLANSLGVAPGKYFLGVEDDPGREVWNYILSAYTWKLGDRVESGAAQEWYHRANEVNRLSPRPATGMAYLRPIVIEYELNGDPAHRSRSEGFLEFSAEGELIGGEWLKSEHPDILKFFTQSLGSIPNSRKASAETQNFLRELLRPVER